MSRTWRYTLIALGIITIALLLTDMKLMVEQRQPVNSALLPTLAPTGTAPIVPASSPTAALSPTPALDTQNALTHTVQTGETLYGIAQRYGITTETLAALNSVADPSLVFVGQTLLIPQTAITRMPTAVPTEPPPTTEVPTIEQPTMLPSATPTLLTVALAVTYPPPPTALNGLPIETFVILPEGVRQNIRQIYANGQARGNNPRAFTKIGDSIIEHPYFLGRFDGGDYHLGEFGYLQQVIDYFAGSFGRPSVAVRRGLHSWSVLDPMWSDKNLCQPRESVMACELRLSRASVVFIRLGTNDVGIPDEFDENMRGMVAFAIENGVIPVLGTKADRHEGSDINNTIIRQITADYQIPLWDFDLVAQTIPGKGLEVDGVHLTVYYAHDYTSPEAFRRGHGVHNLSALLMLDRIWRVVSGG